jgi:AcrR family transcriptional regulator
MIIPSIMTDWSVIIEGMIMTPKRVDKEARREDILRAAVRVFARQGYAATRVEDVAREAGVAKGSVYLSFADREELLDAAIERLRQRSAGVLARARDGDGASSATQRLRALATGTVALLAEDPDLARILLDLWARRGEDAAPVDMAAVYAEYRAVVSALLRRGRDEGQVRADTDERHAAVVVGAIEGCLLQWLVDPSVDLAELAEPITEVCLAGLMPREGR